MLLPPILRISVLQVFYVIHVIFSRCFSHGNVVRGLINLWVRQEARVLKMSLYLRNEASDIDNDIV